MPGVPPFEPQTPFKQGRYFQKLVYRHQKSSHPLSNPFRLALIDYLYTYRDNMEYIPERMDVPFVRICLLKYLARYVTKWKGFDEKLFSTSKINRDRNRDCIKVCDGFRGVWNKWKKSCHANKLTH